MTTKANTSILISGASIGGPALAYWLAEYGFTVTVVERAPELRKGGQAVDFKGAIHNTVITRMGIKDDVYANQTGGTDQPIVDSEGKVLTVMTASFTGGDVEIRRGDLASILYERTASRCTYRFGDSITSLTETEKGVDVTFQNGAPQTFDLVVGADGIHSNTRRLVFGPETNYVKNTGFYYALAEMDNPGGPWMYNEPGRMASLGGPKAPVFFVFHYAEENLNQAPVERQKEVLASIYEGAGFKVPEILKALPEARDLYVDTISRVEIGHYAKGRVVLLGDSAYGNTLGGFGTGLATVGAYVLAGELALADGDHKVAFANYEAAMKKYATVARQGNAGRFLAPRTKRGIKMRNMVFKYSPLFSALEKLTDRFATDIELKDYGALLEERKKKRAG